MPTALVRYCLLGFFLAVSAQAQTQLMLHGHVRDGAQDKPIAGASVADRKLGMGTQTDSSGYFRMMVPPGTYNLTVSAVGFYSRTQTLLVNRANVRLEVALMPDIRQLDEVNVTGQTPDANVSGIQMSQIRLDLKNLRNIPVVFGEADIIKALMLQPGVSTVGEGAGGFNVRGGRTDQNLVLLDGAPLFNTSHLLGLLSNLNPDAIQDVTLYKGGIPAAYGGRLSSLLLMNTKTGETDRLHLTGGIGLITSRVQLSGPITTHKKLTFLAGGRIAYPSLLLKRFPAPTNQNRASFYDLNGRLTYRLAPNSRLSATAYRSFDTFKFPQDTLYTTQSTLLTAHWHQQLTPTVSVHAAATQSDFRFFLDGLNAYNAYRYQSGIRQRDGRIEVLWLPARAHRIEAGSTLTAYTVSPGTITPTDKNSNIIALALPTEQAREWAVFASDEWMPLRWLSVQAGVRFGQFANVGPGVAYTYEPNLPRSRETITDTTRFGRGQRMAAYGGWEPRLTLRLRLSEQQSVKLNYNRTRQYLHLISNTTAISPIDFWKISNALIPPQLADQWAIGYFRNLNHNQFETSIELYYKTLTNLVEYRNGATLLLNPALDADLVSARGQTYGLEISLQKVQGLLTGQLAYTYARSWTQVPSRFAQLQINGGRWYPSTFDRPHNLTVAAQWKWRYNWTFGANFVYTSGRPTTYPDGTYQLNGVKVLDYSQRNADRLPAYHRLDVAFTKDGRKHANQQRYSSWSFTFYNVYARKNPYSIYFQSVNTTPQPYRLSVFGTIIPSVSWNFTY